MNTQTMENLLAELKSEMDRFERGNKAAGRRARKIAQEIKAECQRVRVWIQTRRVAQ